MATGGPEPLQQQSAQLAQQAVQDNAKREQAGGKKKPPFATLLPYLGSLDGFDILSTAIGNLQSAGNLSQFSAPGIVNHLNVEDTSIAGFFKKNMFIRRDIAWVLEQMHGDTKEDVLFGEKQKFEGDKSEREQLLHKAQEDPSHDYHEKHRPQQDYNHNQDNHQKHDDSDGSYWRGIQMAENQRRMAKPHDSEVMAQEAHHQKEWSEWAKSQIHWIEEKHRHTEQRKRVQSRTI